MPLDARTVHAGPGWVLRSTNVLQGPSVWELLPHASEVLCGSEADMRITSAALGKRGMRALLHAAVGLATLGRTNAVLTLLG